ncbi:hypothetical protein MCAV_04360 [[Mycoplasma] cavipharyngis]|uniref:hypothetical protein n=1 Tax=[Mycoplasma] cavipharyngis TaxID=92757 RepID=UPI0037049000
MKNIKFTQELIEKRINQVKRKLIKNKNAFKIDLIIKYLTNYQEYGHVVAIAGLAETGKTKLLADLFTLTNNGLIFPELQKENNFKLSFNKKTKLKNFFLDTNVFYFKNIKQATIKEIIQDINQNLRNNLIINNFGSWKHFKWLKEWLNFRKIVKINRKIISLEKAISASRNLEQNKLIWPILTTLTTMGTSIGTPLLSLALLRQDVIINLLGSHSYLAILIFSILLITIGIFSVISYLISNIYINRTSNITSDYLLFYQKLLEKNFNLLKDQNNKFSFSFKKLRNKVNIKTKFNYFYDGINKNSPDYKTIMNLLQIMQAMNNNIFFTVTFEKTFEHKQIFDNSWNDQTKCLVWTSENFKNSTNNRLLIQFILKNLSVILKIDAFDLYRKNQEFTETIFMLLEYVDNDTKIINFLTLCKLYYRGLENFMQHKFGLEYFYQTLPLIILKAINNLVFNEVYYRTTNHFSIDFSDNNSYVFPYNHLKLNKILNDNWKKFGANSIIFQWNKFFDNHSFIDILNNYKASLENSLKFSHKISKTIAVLLKQREYHKTDIKEKSQYWKAILYTNDLAENLIWIKFENINILTPNESENLNLFDQIYQIKNKSYTLKAKYIIMEFHDYYFTLQKSLNDYELLHFF